MSDHPDDNTDEWFWYYSRGSDPESCYGEFDSRDEAIGEARGMYGEDEEFCIVEARKKHRRELIVDADAVMELILDSNEDQWGEDGFDDYVGPEGGVTKAGEDLNEVLKAWMERHYHIYPRPWVFAETRNLEVFNTPATEVKMDIDAFEPLDATDHHEP